MFRTQNGLPADSVLDQPTRHAITQAYGSCSSFCAHRERLLELGDADPIDSKQAPEQRIETETEPDDDRRGYSERACANGPDPRR